MFRRIARKRTRKARPSKSDRTGSVLMHAGGAALLVFCFFLALFLFFPADALRDRLELEIRENSPLTVSMAKAELLFPFGITIEKVRLQPPGEKMPQFQLESLRATPAWMSLFSEPAADLEARLYGGRVEGSLRRHGGFEAQIAQIAIAALFPEDLPYRGAGRLGGTVSADGAPHLAATQTTFDLALEDAAALGLERIGIQSGRIGLGQIRARGSVQGNSIRVEEITADGGDLIVDGRATLLVAKSPQLSRITAQLDIRPTQSLDPAARDLFLLSGVEPDREGVYRFRISGSLARPVLR